MGELPIITSPRYANAPIPTHGWNLNTWAAIDGTKGLFWWNPDKDLDSYETAETGRENELQTLKQLGNEGPRQRKAAGA